MKLPLKVIVKLFLFLISMILTGCATSPRTHFANLQNDFLDISRASVAGGPIGFGANIKATKFLEVQYDDYEAYRLGWLGRGVGVWNEKSSGGTISTNQFALPYEDDYEFSTSFKLGGSDFIGSVINTQRGRRSGVTPFLQPADEFRLAAYLGFVGLEVGLRPLEAVDFICGLLSLGWLDILEDDQRKSISIKLNIEEGLKEVLEEFIEDKDAIKNEDTFKEAIKDAVKDENAFKEAFEEVLKDEQVWANKEMLKKNLRQAFIDKEVFKSKDDKSLDKAEAPSTP